MWSISALNAHIKISLRNLFLCWLLLANHSGAIAGRTESDTTTIFAAASLTNVMKELSSEWSQANAGKKFQTSHAASAVLARQILAGAPATLLISANRKWVDEVRRGLGLKHGPIEIAHNGLVLAAPCNQNIEVTNASLEVFLSNHRFAMADPATAPAGEYAKAVLQARGLWTTNRTRAALAGNARLALLLIEKNGMPGFIYASDAYSSQSTCSILELSLPDEQRITYFGVSMNEYEEGQLLLRWLLSSRAREIWQKHGFSPVSN